MATALVTGGSRGLGKALADGLSAQGWDVIVDARDGEALEKAATDRRITAVSGDVNDPAHRDRLAATVEAAGGIDLLVNNASTLGPSPLEHLDVVEADVFHRVLATNVVAPLALYQAVAAYLSDGAIVLNVSSDAAVQAYPGWGVYGASKAALDHMSSVLAAERPDLRVYAVDPGDMRTRMQQDAYPGEDISDRTPPEDVVPYLLALIDRRPPSGRYVAAELGVGV